ncbi:MAG: hypothetical protein NTW18_01635 [Candidatus Omnitrophica bacterium]|nr:hypothetical protein [Candidatus Omnitrophota bacterium]
MNKSNLLRSVLIIVIILSLFVALAMVGDDEESGVDFSCNLNYIGISYYKELLDNVATFRCLSYNNDHPASSKQFILYVARQEKSPPSV